MPQSVDERFWAKVDKTGEDSCWLWTAATRKGYGRFSEDPQVKHSAHRFAWERSNGPIPSGMTLDHRHTCPRNCVNPNHLRIATRKQNNENLAGARQSNNSSGIRGVSWHKGTRKWCAHIRHNGQRIHLGYYDTIEDAAVAARLKRRELFTHSDMDH